MAYVLLVIVLALLQFVLFGMAVGRARGKYGVQAPAVHGNEIFERHFRVHMNTLEQLVVFIPAIWLFAQFVDPHWAAGLGGVYLVGRTLYFLSYLKDPKSRGLGFLLSALPSLVMLAGVLVEALRMLAPG
ncbi:MAG TPA: MAPEG family protein [Steroidobacteraceae bacterium]|nr:MAPEG family protein [Steroidobacteraceae bacterium]